MHQFSIAVLQIEPNEARIACVAQYLKEMYPMS